MVVMATVEKSGKILTSSSLVAFLVSFYFFILPFLTMPNFMKVYDPLFTSFSRMESTEKCEVVIQHFNGKYLKTPPGIPGKKYIQEPFSSV